MCVWCSSEWEAGVAPMAVRHLPASELRGEQGWGRGQLDLRQGVNGRPSLD